MELNRPLPSPITPEAQPYWDGLKENKLMLPKCDDCGKPFFYPRVLCPNCHSQTPTFAGRNQGRRLRALTIGARPGTIQAG